MAKPSGAARVTGALADVTGRSDEEVRLALTLAAAAASVIAVLRVLRLLDDLGVGVIGRSKH